MLIYLYDVRLNKIEKYETAFKFVLTFALRRHQGGAFGGSCAAKRCGTSNQQRYLFPIFRRVSGDFSWKCRRCCLFRNYKSSQNILRGFGGDYSNSRLRIIGLTSLSYILLPKAIKLIVLKDLNF